MATTKYVVRLDGQIIGQRVTRDRVYTHAIVARGHGKNDHVTAWCGRLDLAQRQAKEWSGYGYTCQIVAAEVFNPASKAAAAPAPAVAVHTFSSTGDAYDACQCREDIKNGDILLIKEERVIGIADTWPVAVTLRTLHLHEPTTTLAECFKGRFENVEASIELAKQEAAKLGWPVRA